MGIVFCERMEIGLHWYNKNEWLIAHLDHSISEIVFKYLHVLHMDLMCAKSTYGGDDP